MVIKRNTTVAALHTLNNTVAKGFNQMAPPVRTTPVALDIMNKAFETLSTHIHYSTPGTVIKFVANYIKRRKALLLSEIANPYKVRLKLAFLKAATYHPPYLTPIYSRYSNTHRTGTSNDITITSTHTSTSAARKYIKT